MKILSIAEGSSGFMGSVVSSQTAMLPQDNLHDRFCVEARRVGDASDSAWFDVEAILPLPADQARRAVADLNAAVPAFVYRAVLVSHV